METTERRTPRDSYSVHLSATDFGPIAHADVTFRPLTVFIGQSNTGKSYLAILLYALQQALWHHVDARGTAQSLAQRISAIPNKEISKFQNFLTKLAESSTTTHNKSRTRRARLSRINLSGLPKFITEPIIETLTTTLHASISTEIARCFQLNSASDIRRRVPSASRPYLTIALSVGSDDQSSESYRFRHFTRIPKSGEGSTTVEMDPTIDLPLYPWYRALNTRDGRSPNTFELEMLIDGLIGELRSGGMGRLGRYQTYYLPAARSGTMEAHKLMVSALVQRASLAGVRRQPALPTLSGVTSDFISSLVDLPATSDRSARRRRRPLTGLAELFEETILGGSVRVATSETGYPEFLYQPASANVDLSFGQCSSMVSELGPVVLYLRYLVGIGDTLIVEEPEAHLHPSMQVTIADAICVLVNAGVRVVITTHSDTILRALENNIRKGHAYRGSHNNQPASALTSDSISIYHFHKKPGTKGSTADELTFSDQGGIVPEEFEKISLDLYNEAVDLFNRVRS